VIRGDQAQRNVREALGRSRGGFGTKVCVIADGAGRAVAFMVALGQAHELPQAIPLLYALPGVLLWVVADRGASSYAFREHIRGQGAAPAIPFRRNKGPVACPDWAYNNRNLVERLWARLKEWLAAAIRYEKTATSIMGVLCLATAISPFADRIGVWSQLTGTRSLRKGPERPRGQTSRPPAPCETTSRSGDACMVIVRDRTGDMHRSTHKSAFIRQFATPTAHYNPLGQAHECSGHKHGG